MNAPTTDLTDEQLRLLRRGAESMHGFLCVPYEAKGRMTAVYQQMVKLGLVVWVECRPLITNAGRDLVASLDAPPAAPDTEPVADALLDVMMAPHYAPQDFSRRRHEKIVLALVLTVDPADERPLSIKASTDGDDAHAVVFPRKVIEILHRDGRFIVAAMKGWVAIDRKVAQGSVPVLTKSVAWTDGERVAWRRIKTHLARSRDGLKRQRKGYQPSHDRLPYGYTA